MKLPLASLSLAFILASCASSIPYSADYPMTESNFRSRDRMFTGRIPEGWFSSTEDSLAGSLNAWLIREDFSATLSVKELILDNLSADRVRHDGLKLLSGLNAALEHHGQTVRPPEEFRLNGRSYCAYEFRSDSTEGRAVVFTAQEKYYACTAQIAKGTGSKEELKNLFRAQQTFLATLGF